MSNLYELTSDLEILKNMDEIEDTKEIVSLIEAEIINKGTGIVKLDRIFDANIKAIKNEIDRLQAKKRVVENNRKRLREYTISCLENLGQKKIETPVGNMTIRKTASILRIADESKLPEKYLEVVQTHKINKDMIKSDLKLGINIDGAYMTEPGTTLMIK